MLMFLLKSILPKWHKSTFESVVFTLTEGGNFCGILFSIVGFLFCWN